MAGVIMRFTHRYKVCALVLLQRRILTHYQSGCYSLVYASVSCMYSLLFLFSFLLRGFCSGVGLLIHTRGANSSNAEIVWTQLLQGIGGGFASVTTQVGAQASVPHADVAVITAIVLLWTEIGGSVGSAIGKYLSPSIEWVAERTASI